MENSGYFLYLLKVTNRFAHWARFLFLPHVGYSHFPLRVSSILLLTGFVFVACLFTPVQASVPHSVSLASDTEIATAGFYQLQWESEQSGTWHLQESNNANLEDYKVIYTGPDLARIISGKPDGIYYYRIVTANKPAAHMSNIVKVTVAHHPLTNAFLFFIVGAFIFLAILLSILKGNRNNTQA